MKAPPEPRSAQPAPANKPAAREEILTFEDNRAASLLVGHFDQNIARIEQKLGLTIHVNGNRFALAGEAGAVAQARDALHRLYGLILRGHMLEAGDIDGALEEAAAPPLPLELSAQASPLARDSLAPPPLAHGYPQPLEPPLPNALAARDLPPRDSSSGVSSLGDSPARGSAAQESRRSAKPREANPQEPARGFEDILTRKRGATRARNAAQDVYLRLLARKELVFAEGPAGTGKTWLAVGHAVHLLEQGVVERLILSRPAVEAGEKIGFLPGDMRDKVDPYLRPIYDALYDFMDGRLVERALQTGLIEVAPLAFMRGRTLSRALVLLDEAQNASSMQMKMFLTRLGEGSRMIVTGDPTQIDLPPGQVSGFSEAIKLLAGVDGIGHIRFSHQHVVRHDLVRRIVAAYEGASAQAPNAAPAAAPAPRKVGA